MNIKSDRLTIRRIQADDWQDIKEIWMDQKASAYGKYDQPNDTEDPAVQSRIAKWASCSDSSEHMFFAVCLNKEVIGFFAFNSRSAWGEPAYEIGYAFKSAYCGHGYAGESLDALLDYVRAHYLVRRFTAGTALANTPSVDLLLSSGFMRIGTEQVSFYKDEQGKGINFTGGIYELAF